MLSTPQARRHLHQRAVTFNGYARDDGLWDIEAHLRDTKSHDFSVGERIFNPGEAIHDMEIRLTVNQDLIVQDIETLMRSTPHPECPEATAAMKKMIGCSLKSGWRKSIEENLGGVAGCTHLRELLFNMATAAFQSDPKEFFTNQETEKPPTHLGKCKAWDFNGPVVMRIFPKFYQWKNPEGKT